MPTPLDDNPPISPTREPAPHDGTRDPVRTRRNLLDAAYHEFAAHGFHGTTVDQICKRAGVSKQILSHHFGSKEGAHLAVLEAAYIAARTDYPQLADEGLDPVFVMRSFVARTFDYLVRNRAFVWLQADENVNRGKHIKKSEALPKIYDPLIRKLDALLRRGEQQGVFRAGFDARQIYISISALCYFYFSNAYTMSAVFETPLMEEAAITARRSHVIDFMMAALEAPKQREGR